MKILSVMMRRNIFEDAVIHHAEESYVMIRLFLVEKKGVIHLICCIWFFSDFSSQFFLVFAYLRKLQWVYIFVRFLSVVVLRIKWVVSVSGML